VPTLVDVVMNIARGEGMHMDEKQYITYEVLCCTFLLGLVNEGSDSNSKLQACLQKAISN